jgi:hypothetical protein
MTRRESAVQPHIQSALTPPSTVGGGMGEASRICITAVIHIGTADRSAA